MSTRGNKNESRGGGSRGRGSSRERGSSWGRGTSGNGQTVRATNPTNTPLAQDISQENEERILLAEEENHGRIDESMETEDEQADEETAQLPSHLSYQKVRILSRFLSKANGQNGGRLVGLIGMKHREKYLQSASSAVLVSIILETKTRIQIF